MAVKYVLKDAKTGWYLGRIMHRGLMERDLVRALSPIEDATRFTSKAKAEKAAEKLKADTGRAYIVEKL